MKLKSFLLIFFVFATSPALAQGIAVTVNGQAISDYDVSQRQKLLGLAGGGATRQKALDELIDEQIKLQEAKKLNVTVTDGQVSTAYAQIASRSKMSPENFTRAIASRGVEAKTLQDRLRAELAWQNVVRFRARSAMNIREQDVNEALRKKGRDPENLTSYEYSVRQAMVFGASADARRKAEAFRSSVKGCDTAVQKAQTFKDAAVRAPVRRAGSEISGPLAELLDKTPVGGTTPIQPATNGFEFMILCEKIAVSGSDGAKTRVRNELMAKEAAGASERMLRELRQKANISNRKK